MTLPGVPAARAARAKAWDSRNGVVRFRSRTADQSEAVVSVAGPRRMRPALLTRMATWPSWSRLHEISSVAAWGVRPLRSATRTAQRTPRARTCAATSARSPMSIATMSAPASASARDSALPESAGRAGDDGDAAVETEQIQDGGRGGGSRVGHIWSLFRCSGVGVAGDRTARVRRWCAGEPSGGYLRVQGFVEDAVVVQGAACGLLGENDRGDSDHGQDRQVDADGQGVSFLDGAQQ